MMVEQVRWPALSGGIIPDSLQLQRAVWGKVHGAASDFRWIAAGGFNPQKARLERELRVGGEEQLQSFPLWRSLGSSHYAVSAYPSRATDAQGRTGFLEKQVLRWRRAPHVPAALGAFKLLPLVASYSDEVWWDKRYDPRWEERDFVIALADHDESVLDTQALSAAISTSIDALRTAIDEEALGAVYAGILAGQRPTALLLHGKPLPHVALPALLLPLPREYADQLSLAGWLPSQRAAADKLRQQWDVVGVDDSTPSWDPGVVAGKEIRAKAERMARALLAGDPSRLIARNHVPVPPEPAREGPKGQVRLTLWGPSAAGKTAMLAMLYLEASSQQSSQSDSWRVFPTEESMEFIQQKRHEMETMLRFPPPTQPGEGDRIDYRFCRSDGSQEASLCLEDRAGKEWEVLDDDGKRRIAEANGVAFLFDPTRGEKVLSEELCNTLEGGHVAGRRGAERDPRPIAVCLSKSDLLIETSDDLVWARDDPDDFVREHINPKLLLEIDRFCLNYRLFPVSAIGVNLCRGRVEPVFFYDDTLTPRLLGRGKPFNLMAPFTWLINEVTK